MTQWKTTRNFVSIEELKSRSRHGDGVYLPDETQGIWKAHDLVLEQMGAGRNVVLLGLDALPYTFLRRHLPSCGNQSLFPVTSVLPSTSTCCWTSILTGQMPAVHGVHGVVFYEQGAKTTVHALRPASFRHPGGMVSEQNEILLIKPESLLFAKIRTQFKKIPYVIGRLAFDIGGPLHQQLTRGCVSMVAKNYETLIEDPVALVRDNLVSIAANARADAFVFCYFNFDTYIHSHSYTDKGLLDAFAMLVEGCNNLSRKLDVSFVYVSDHGMIAQSGVIGSCPFDDAYVARRSYAYPGGAGRILYFYPNHRDVHDVKRYLADLLGDTAFVLEREEYVRSFLRTDVASVNKAYRIGDVVVVGKTGSFPSVMSKSHHEHGSCSEDEMFAALGFIES